MAFGSKAFGASYFAEPSFLLTGVPGVTSGYSVGGSAAESHTIALDVGEGRTVYVAAGEAGSIAEATSTIHAIGAALAEILDKNGGLPPL